MALSVCFSHKCKSSRSHAPYQEFVLHAGQLLLLATYADLQHQTTAPTKLADSDEASTARHVVNAPARPPAQRGSSVLSPASLCHTVTSTNEQHPSTAVTVITLVLLVLPLQPLLLLLQQLLTHVQLLQRHLHHTVVNRRNT